MAHTHKGTCQVCGSLQAVNEKTGMIAQHGYTVEHGWFEGRCFGSLELPLNVSKNLIDAALAHWSNAVTKISVKIEDLKTSTDPNVMQVNYVFKGGRRWVHEATPFTVSEQTKVLPGHKGWKSTCIDTVEQAVANYNKGYAFHLRERVLPSAQAQVDRLSQFVTTWHPTPLIPKRK